MVQTFVVSGDFRETARLLDWRRLGKQRVEAQQILNVLENLAALARVPLVARPNGVSWAADWSPRSLAPETFAADVRQIRRQYRTLGVELAFAPDGTVWAAAEAPVGSRAVRLGFASHSIAAMWFGYEDALRAYINAMIDEWVARGYRNTMRRHALSGRPIVQPPWTLDAALHANHRAALRHKEQTRGETPWYVRLGFTGDFTGYLWYSPTAA